MIYSYFYSPEHVTKDCTELLKKWEDKKANCSTVHENPWKNKKKNEEFDVQVVTQGGKNSWEFFYGKGSS